VAFGRLLQQTVVVLPAKAGEAPQQALVSPYRGGEITKALNDFLASKMDVLRDDGEYVRASDLFDLCSRERALRRKFNVVTVEQPSPSLRLMFDIGTAMHDLIRDKYLGPMQVLYGEWLCLRCGQYQTGTMPKFCSCSRYASFTYHERTVKNPEWKVKGHLDGVMLNPVRGKGVLEIKSIDGKMFDTLRAPLPEHVFRTVVYQWLSGMSWGVVVYACKGMKFPSSFKDFVVEYDDSIITKVKATLTELRSGGQRVCGSERDKRAQRCPVSRQCWANA